MLKKKKLVFISLPGYPYFNTKKEKVFGGAELQIYMIASEMAKDKKYDVSVLVADEGQENIEYYGKVKVVKTVKVADSEMSLKKNFKKLLLFYRVLKSEGPDILYKRGSGRTLIICVLYKIFNPTTSIIYNVANTRDINGSRYKGIKGLFFYIALKFVDIIVVQTQEQYSLLSKKEKNKVPKEGIIKNIFYVDDSFKKKKKEYILWVARCVKFKQPEVYLQLAKDFPEEKFVIVCPKVDIQLWNKIKESSERVPNIKFIESVPYSKIQKYFEQAKVFVNTSTHEGYPNTFLQAASTETPILSLSINPDDVLSKYNIGICCENDYNLLKKYLSQLIKDEKFVESFSKNGKKYVQQEHRIDKNIQKLKSIFNEI